MPTGPQTEEHKAAIQEGRQQGIVIRRYLDWVETYKPKKGRRRSIESVDKQLASIDEQMSSGDNLVRLALIQQRLDLLAERDEIQLGLDAGAVEERFVEVAKDYSERRGITYTAWREFGVKAEVLEKAGIGRSPYAASTNGNHADEATG